jgi:hopanoid biosynthesis associated radical SAM protein HpnH
MVCTNTTIYRETDLGEIDRLFAYLTKLGVDGFLLAPAYGYAAVQQTNPQGAAEIFMTRDDIRVKFKEAEKLLYKYRMMSSPIYLEFLSGKREMTCTAWGNPTRNVKGWKGPCYLITDEHHATFQDLMENTPWEKYGYGKDPRCEHCLMHCGYEPSAALGVNGKLGDSLKMMLWQLS